MATAPLAFSTATIGWRGSFLAVGVCTALIGLLIALVLKDDGRARGRHETLRESWSGIAAVIRTPSIGRLFVMHLVIYSTFGLIVGLWGGPYLTHIYGYDLEGRGNILLIPVLTQMIGSLFWGPIDRLFGSYKLPVLVGAGATAAALGYLALAGTLTPVMLVTWFALFGLVTAFGPVLIAHGRALFPLHLVGRGLTLLNIGTMGGGFLAQSVSGFVIELVSRSRRRGLSAGGLPRGVRPAGRVHHIGIVGLFRRSRSEGTAWQGAGTFVPCIGAHPLCTNRSISLTFPLAFCAVRCILLRCGSASRYRRPPWAFPP